MKKEESDTGKGKGQKYLHTEKFKVEQQYEEKVMAILEENGFTGIRKMPYQSLFDFLAMKGKKLCYIELKSRSEKAKTQTFTFPHSKLERLKDLKGNDFVYLLFINKFGHRLVEIDDFLSCKTDVQNFKVSVYGKGKDYDAYYFNMKKEKWESTSTSKKQETTHLTLQTDSYFTLVHLKSELKAKTWKELVVKIEKRLDDCDKKYPPVF